MRLARSIVKSARHSVRKCASSGFSLPFWDNSLAARLDRKAFDLIPSAFFASLLSCFPSFRCDRAKALNPSAMQRWIAASIEGFADGFSKPKCSNASSIASLVIVSGLKVSFCFAEAGACTLRVLVCTVAGELDSSTLLGVPNRPSKSALNITMRFDAQIRTKRSINLPGNQTWANR